MNRKDTSLSLDSEIDFLLWVMGNGHIVLVCKEAEFPLGKRETWLSEQEAPQILGSLYEAFTAYWE